MYQLYVQYSALYIHVIRYYAYNSQSKHEYLNHDHLELLYQLQDN